MTEKEISLWIKKNLGPVIQTALQGNTVYTEDWLAAMAQREVGFLIARYNTAPLITVASLMRGDFSQREGETQKQFHGYSFWQIDVNSYPEFIKGGDWKDPLKSCLKAIAVLTEKRSYITDHMPGLSGDALDRANTAAYNCGPGSVMKALIHREDVDQHTYNHDYSKEVWRFRTLYKSL